MYMVNMEMHTVCTTVYVCYDHVGILPQQTNTPLAASHYDYVYHVFSNY